MIWKMDQRADLAISGRALFVQKTGGGAGEKCKRATTKLCRRRRCAKRIGRWRPFLRSDSLPLTGGRAGSRAGAVRRVPDRSQLRGCPYKRSCLGALRPKRISAMDPPSIWWPGER